MNTTVIRNQLKEIRKEFEALSPRARIFIIDEGDPVPIEATSKSLVIRVIEDTKPTPEGF